MGDIVIKCVFFVYNISSFFIVEPTQLFHGETSFIHLLMRFLIAKNA